MAGKNKGNYQIPFSQTMRNGVLSGPYHLDSYPERHSVWKDNYEFKATLVLTGYSRGRSAARMCLLDQDTGSEYEMFLTDFCDILEDIVHGAITGTWTFCKRGMNYGIRMVK